MENQFKVGDRVYHEYVGAGDQVKKVYGRVIDIWHLKDKTYVDVQFGRFQTFWPIRAELVHPDDGQGTQEPRHVLC